MNLGTAYVVDLQLEIIQPLSGEVDVYRDHLPGQPDQFALRSHHICSRFDTIEEYEAALTSYPDRGYGSPAKTSTR